MCVCPQQVLTKSFPTTQGVVRVPTRDAAGEDQVPPDNSAHLLGLGRPVHGEGWQGLGFRERLTRFSLGQICSTSHFPAYPSSSAPPPLSMCLCPPACLSAYPDTLLPPIHGQILFEKPPRHRCRVELDPTSNATGLWRTSGTRYICPSWRRGGQWGFWEGDLLSGRRKEDNG